jgi:hypothetical protein
VSEAVSEAVFIGQARPAFVVDELTKVHHSRLGLVTRACYAVSDDQLVLDCYAKYALFEDYDDMLREHVERGLVLLRKI